MIATSSPKSCPRYTTQLPPPPAELDTSPPEVDPNLSTRERYAEHSDWITFPMPAETGQDEVVRDVIARLRPGESLPRSGRTEAPEGQVPTIHLPLIAEALGGDPAFITSAYGVMVSETPAAASVPNQLESPSEDPGPYLSYAIQWILFAVMGFFFIGYVIRTEVRHRREETDDTPRPPRGQRRRDRDMAEEDEILDRLPQ